MKSSPALEAPPRLFTVTQFCGRHCWATPGGIRHLLFHRNQNGFACCVKQLGRRILLDEAEVLRWLESQSVTANNELGR